jgi:hypothetical protein
MRMLISIFYLLSLATLSFAEEKTIIGTYCSESKDNPHFCILFYENDYYDISENKSVKIGQKVEDAKIISEGKYVLMGDSIIYLTEGVSGYKAKLRLIDDPRSFENIKNTKHQEMLKKRKSIKFEQGYPCFRDKIFYCSLLNLLEKRGSTSN